MFIKSFFTWKNFVCNPQSESAKEYGIMIKFHEHLPVYDGEFNENKVSTLYVKSKQTSPGSFTIPLVTALWLDKSFFLLRAQLWCHIKKFVEVTDWASF